MSGGRRAIIALVLLLLAAFPTPARAPSSSPANSPPLAAFIANVGQLSNTDVRLYHTSPTLQVGFAEGAVLYRVLPRPKETIGGAPDLRVDQSGALVRAVFQDGDPVPPVGRRELEARANYLLGNDPDGWRTRVPTYEDIVYADVWPGISVVYRAESHGVKYAYELRAGASPSSIAIAYEGADRIGITNGELVVSTAAGELRDSAPTAEQNGLPVTCVFRMTDSRTVGLACPGWDRSGSGVIDPLVWVTYLGARGRDDLRSVAVDDAGFVYAAGHTGSTDFPTTPGAFNTTYGGGFYDVYVAKLRPGGDQLVWATYLGGTGEEYGLSIGIDGNGSAYVTGYTTSADFPTWAALDSEWNSTDAFIAKLAPSGDALVFSTFLGGTGEEAGAALAVAPDGSVVLVGVTGSLDFPTTAGAPNRTHNGGFFDAFVTKLAASGATLVYSTYLGGAFVDSAVAVAIDAAGAAYVTGGTISPNFYTTPGSYDEQYNDVGPTPLGDAYLTKVNPLGTAYVYSTFLGGEAADSAWGVQVDRAGRAYVAGYTESTAFPTTPGAMNETANGGGDTFVSALSPAGNLLARSTFLGGTAADQAFALQLDALDNPYVAGSTVSTDFPATPDAPNGTALGGRDAFVVHLNSSLDALLFGTYFGGAGHDDLYALTIDPYGNAYVGGLTLSTDLPTTLGAFDRTCGTDGACDFDGVQSYSDAFLGKIKIANPVTLNITVTTFPPALQVRVDGALYTAPHTFACVLDTTHAVDTPSPQVTGSTRYVFDRWSDGGAQNHTFTCLTNATITAIFLTEYEVVVTTSPTGLALVVDATPIIAPGTYWWDDGSTHELAAPSPQGSGGTRRTFFLWSDGGARVHIVTIGGAQTFVASFLTEHNVTVTADPVGLIIEVDGVSPSTPYNFWCLAGSTHTVNATSPQLSGQVRRTFRAWSDAGAQNHTFSCNTPATYTAFFDTDYEVTVDTLPLLLEVLVDGVAYTAPRTFWCSADSTHSLNVASPQGVGFTRYVFAAWSDGLPRFHSFACSAPATFLATFDTEHWVVIDTSPPGLQVTVDGATANASQAFWWLEGSSHELDVPTPQFGNSTRYTFAMWLDDPNLARTIIVTAPARYVARFNVDYLITFDTDPVGLQLSVDGLPVATPYSAWWANGSSLTVSASSPQIVAPGLRYVFEDWSDGGSQVRLFQVSEPIALTAIFRKQYRLALSSEHGTPTCDVPDCWYESGAVAHYGIETLVADAPGTRFAFRAWIGNVSSTSPSGAIVMDWPKYASAAWRTEFFLRVDSLYGTAVGEGWYSAGTRANYSVSPTEVLVGGRRYVFRGWTGDDPDAPSGSILMDGPAGVTAVWEEPSDWWVFFLPLAVIPFLVLFFLWRRKKREGAAPADAPTPREPSDGDL